METSAIVPEHEHGPVALQNKSSSRYIKAHPTLLNYMLKKTHSSPWNHFSPTWLWDTHAEKPALQLVLSPFIAKVRPAARHAARLLAGDAQTRKTPTNRSWLKWSMPWGIIPGLVSDGWKTIRFFWGFRPTFRGEVLVLGSINVWFISILILVSSHC